MKNFLRQEQPKLLILVDYPGFNLLLARVAQKAGIKVLYYISPKVWAWHQSRIKIIKKTVDMMAVIFPFEVEFYHSHQIPVKFVGNPLLKLIKQTPQLDNPARKFGLNENYQTVGLLPGSRLSEIKRLLPPMLQAAARLKQHHPQLQLLLSQAPSIATQDLAPYLNQATVKPQIIAGNSYEMIQACDAIIAASGTATLEITLLETPLIIIYKLPWLEYLLAKHLIKTPYIGLSNILAQEKFIPELIQQEVNPQKIAEAVEKILYDLNYRENMLTKLKQLKTILQSYPKEQLTKIILSMLDNGVVKE